MQTYEIAPDESMESLVRSLSRLARRDKDILLIVPTGVNPFTQPESVQKLHSVLRSYDARVQVQAAEPAIVHLFQDAGFLAGPLQDAPAPAAPVAPVAPAVAVSPAPAPAGGAADLPPDIENMNFDYLDVGGGAPVGMAGPPAGAPPPAKGGGGFFQRLRAAVVPPAPPGRADAYPAPPPAGATPDWYGQGAGRPAEASAAEDGPDESRASNLDVTLPDWLRDAPPDAGDAGNRGGGRVPASNLDVTMPGWLSEAAAGAPAGGAADAAGGLPSWLSESGNGPGGTTDADLPDWLRTAPAVPAAPPAGPGAAPPPPVVALPPMPPPAAPAAGPPPARQPSIGAPAGVEPGPAPAAPPAAPAPAPPPGWDLSAMAGPPQTGESIGQAVRAAGLDARTRALLLFGMALVRLAGGEAAGAAAAARQAGCSDDDLRLVVQMAQALGGGPSERLGRRILG